MAKQKSHKQRAIDLLTELGWTCVDTEHRAYGRTFDLLGFCDVLAFNGQHHSGTLFLQVTNAASGRSGGHVSHRVKKILAEPLAIACLHARNAIEVWGIRDKPGRDGTIVIAKRFNCSIGGDIDIRDGSCVLPRSYYVGSTTRQREGAELAAGEAGHA